MSFDLAQVNISRLLAPLDSPQLADFIAALDEVNGAGERAPGFRWRLQTEDGNATSIRAFEWDAGESYGVIVNLTTWASVEDLASFVFGAAHTPIMRRRRQWFAKVAVATTALWWVPAGHRPTTGEAEDRLRHLRLHGPTSYAFTLRQSWTAPDATGATGEPNVNEAWFCPA